MEAPDDGTRIYFDSVDDAIREYKLPLENQPLAREVLATVRYGRIYIPSKSRPYIAFEGPDGPPVAAYLNTGYIDVHKPEGGYDTTEFPTNARGRERRRATTPGFTSADARTCPTCQYALPATGVCDNCA